MLSLGLCAGLVAIAVGPASRDSLDLTMVIAIGLHFVVLTAMWMVGLASAGLLRYFVFVYPAFLLIASLGRDRLFVAFDGRLPAAIPALCSVILVVTVAQLAPTVRPPEWQCGLLTAVPDNRLRFVPRYLAVQAAATIYTDWPEVL